MQRTCRRIVPAAAILMALTTGALALEGDVKIGFINLDKTFNEYYRTKIADAQLKAQAQEFNDERKTMLEELDALKTKFTELRDEAQNKALSDEARTQKMGQAEEQLLAIREQEGKVKRFEDLRAKQLEDQSRRMRRGLVGEIREVVKNFAVQQGYTVIIDSSGLSLNGIESVIYLEPKVDITAQVVDLLNKGEGQGEPAGGSDAGAGSAP